MIFARNAAARPGRPREYDREEDLERREARDMQRNAEPGLVPLGADDIRSGTGRRQAVAATAAESIPTGGDSRERPANLWERSARERKALRLADLLAAIGASADDAARMSEDDWERLRVIAAWQGMPSGVASPETRLLVVEMLARREEAARMVSEAGA